jgi:hypothetical protein
MSKSAVKHLDQAVATELGLQNSPFAMTFKHARQLHRVITGFVFAFEKDGLVHFDEVGIWDSTQGLRHKVTRFISHPRIEQRLSKRQYQRWYVRDENALYPLQTAKVEDLKDNFYFVVDDNPCHRTQIVMNEETQFIRKKPLLAMRKPHIPWGVPMPVIVVTKRQRMAVAT